MQCSNQEGLQAASLLTTALSPCRHSHGLPKDILVNNGPPI